MKSMKLNARGGGGIRGFENRDSLYNLRIHYDQVFFCPQFRIGLKKGPNA